MTWRTCNGTMYAYVRIKGIIIIIINPWLRKRLPFMEEGYVDCVYVRSLFRCTCMTKTSVRFRVVRLMNKITKGGKDTVYSSLRSSMWHSISLQDLLFLYYLSYCAIHYNLTLHYFFLQTVLHFEYKTRLNFNKLQLNFNSINETLCY